MGTWGDAPWDNDGAADWFHEFFEGVDVDARMNRALDSEDYQIIRAACFLLEALGFIYVWPGDPGGLAGLLTKACGKLRKMVTPGDDLHEEVSDDFGDDSAVFDGIRAQHTALQERLKAIH